MNNVTVIGFKAEYLPAFIALNREWIEKHFKLEKMDLEQLENPFESILDLGGDILFALKDDIAFGTVALVPHGPRVYEIAKMAVAPSMRGLGYGDLLMASAVNWGRQHSATKLTILSNTVLEPAITLYKKHGFKTVKIGNHPDYERCNIEMELDLI